MYFFFFFKNLGIGRTQNTRNRLRTSGQRHVPGDDGVFYVFRGNNGSSNNTRWKRRKNTMDYLMFLLFSLPNSIHTVPYSSAFNIIYTTGDAPVREDVFLTRDKPSVCPVRRFFNASLRT